MTDSTLTWFLAGALAGSAACGSSPTADGTNSRGNVPANPAIGDTVAGPAASAPDPTQGPASPNGGSATSPPAVNETPGTGGTPVSPTAPPSSGGAAGEEPEPVVPISPVPEPTPASTPPSEPPAADASCGTHKWACWPMPNPPGSGLPNQASYVDNGDGTVTDLLTQLIWQAQQPDATFDWQGAIDYCAGLSLGGMDDWRIPTRIEITSVLDYSDESSGWSSAAFPEARGGFHHTGSDWYLTITQTGAGAGTDFAWAFNMSDGIVSNAYSKANLTPVRCVRSSGAGEAPSEVAIAPPNQYELLAEGEARDNYTGLIWQRADTDALITWDEALDYCANLDLNGNSWRVPTVRELSTLVDEARVAPSINDEIFPDTEYGARSNNWYWASHQKSGASWGLNFDDGFTGFNIASAAWNTFGPAYARCVR